MNPALQFGLSQSTVYRCLDEVIEVLPVRAPGAGDPAVENAPACQC